MSHVQNALSHNRRFALSRPELFDLLAAAESVLAATGEAVALCPAYGARAS